MKGLGCSDSLLTISHHLQKALDVGQVSFIVQLNFNATSDRVSHSSLIYMLKSLGVVGTDWRSVRNS